jgi:Ca2+-binding RTX toxin-like protein
MPILTVVLPASSNNSFVVAENGIGTGFFRINSNNAASYTGVSGFDVLGYNGEDNISGSSGNDVLTGGEGRDFITAGLGNDVLVLRTADTSVNNSNEILDGGGGNDTLRIFGSRMDVTETVLLSIERIEFVSNFTGQNLYEFTAKQFGTSGISLTATISGNANPDFQDILKIAMGSTTSLNLSGLTMLNLSQASDYVSIFGDDDAETITGTSVGDRISGLGGNDIINGGGGIDDMFGGDGTDTYYVNVFNEFVTEDNADTATGGNDLVNFTGTSGTFTLTANVERLILSGTSAINGSGNDLGNTIVGNGAANILDGGVDMLGDLLQGGLGNDTYIINSATDNIVELAGGGTADRAKASVSFTLAIGDNIEFLETTNAALTSFINLTGNEIGQTIIGNAGGNVLKGLGGKDVLDGLAGLDTADFSDKTLAVVATLNGAVATNVTVGGVVEDTIKNIENLTGGKGLDTLTGDGLANILNGGTDALADILRGGLGNDTYIINSATDNIIELAGGGTLDRARCSVSYTLGAGDSIEFLETTNSALTTALNLAGNEFAQIIFGNAGANILNGGIDALADTLIGGFGADTYVINSVNDNIVEEFGDGAIDRAKCSVSFTLGAGDNIEFLETTNAAGVGAINLTGNEFAQTIKGNAGANILNGGIDLVGDTLIGGLGNDSYIINSSNDDITELVGGGTGDRAYCNVSFGLATGDNIEIMSTTNSALTTAINLFGNEIAQSITGNAGINLLNGGGGNDTLTGGLGNDVFLFTTFPDAAANRDVITDYNAASDTIYLEAGAFFGVGVGGHLLNPALFKNLTTGGFEDLDDRILYNDTTGALFYDPDGVNGTAAIQFATLTGAPTVDANDFFVI